MRKWIALAAVAGLLMIVACDTADTENPIVSIVFPANGATVNKGDIVIKAVATDNKGVSKVEFSIGGTLMGTDNNGAADTFQYTWTDTAAQVAGHSFDLVAKAYDAAENTKTSTTVTITIAGGGSGTGPTYHSGTISMDETWYPSGNPHILTGDVSVQDAANSPILTIMPGCIIEFQGDYELYTGYTEAGAIVANGKADADSGILFTTTTSPKTPGSWSSVSIYYRATSATSFKYCTFEYGGSAVSRGTFYVDGANPKFENCTVMQSASSGAVLQSDAGFASFAGNTVSNCGAHAVEIYPEYVKTLGAGNAFTGNTNNDILVHGGDVTTTATWLSHGVPYVLAGNVKVEDQNNSPVLTIAPGCSLKFSGDHEFYTGYNQPGAIVAEGTASAPIVFSTNVTPKTPGSWSSVSIYYRATSATSFKYCTFEYGGSAVSRGTFYVDGVNPKLENCTVMQSASSGAVLQSDAGFASFTGNTVSNCGAHAVEIYPEYVKTLGAGNTFTGNTNNDILVHGGDVTTTATWLNHGVPYVLAGNVEVEDQNNSPVLTIAAGTTVKLQSGVELYCGYNNPGGIIADGTAGQITFTSSIGSPSPGDWESISFYYRAMDSQCQLKNCKILYGGGHSGNVYIQNALPTVTGCEIGYSGDYGIYLTGTEYPDPTQLQTDNTFHDNTNDDIYHP